MDWNAREGNTHTKKENSKKWNQMETNSVLREKSLLF